MLLSPTVHINAYGAGDQRTAGVQQTILKCHMQGFAHALDFMTSHAPLITLFRSS